MKFLSVIVALLLSGASLAADIRVMTSGEVAQVIGLERQKQLLGCSETGASCMAELAGALTVAEASAELPPPAGVAGGGKLLDPALLQVVH